MDIGTRIKDARNALKITQAEFGAGIGLKQNTVATYEMGRNLPSDRTISDICRVYKVNETWLRTGEGEMFIKENPNKEIADFIGDLLLGEPGFKQRVVSVLARLSEDEWQLLERKIGEITAQK